MTPPRILVVEDRHAVGEILKCALEQDGCTAVLAQSGGEALELAQRLRPDLIALDVGVECPGGGQVIAALHADPATCDIPIIAIAARYHDVEPTLMRLVARVFGEPFYPAEIAAAVIETLAELRASTTAQPATRH